MTTNSISQGQQVDLLWPLLFSYGLEIGWAHTSFKWSNLATKKATVTVVIIGLQRKSNEPKIVFEADAKRICTIISPYLVASEIVSIKKSTKQLTGLAEMKLGNMPYGKGLLLDPDEREELVSQDSRAKDFLRNFAGGEEFLHSKARYCLWIDDDELEMAMSIEGIEKRIQEVRTQRLASTDAGGRKLAKKAHQFRERNSSLNQTIVLARTSSESRTHLPVGLVVSGLPCKRPFHVILSSIY